MIVKVIVILHFNNNKDLNQNSNNYNNHKMQEDDNEIKNLLAQGDKLMQKVFSKQSTKSDIVTSNKLRFGVFNIKHEKDNTSDSTKVKNQVILAMDKEYKDNNEILNDDKYENSSFKQQFNLRYKTEVSIHIDEKINKINNNKEKREKIDEKIANQDRSNRQRDKRIFGRNLMVDHMKIENYRNKIDEKQTEIVNG